jgi:hypothetical protein
LWKASTTRCCALVVCRHYHRRSPPTASCVKFGAHRNHLHIVLAHTVDTRTTERTESVSSEKILGFGRHCPTSQLTATCFASMYDTGTTHRRVIEGVSPRTPLPDGFAGQKGGDDRCPRQGAPEKTLRGRATTTPLVVPQPPRELSFSLRTMSVDSELL